eukprot:COSAG02_NODE_34826_length_477_cov_4.235450_1_plen_49_part_10
MVRWHRCGRGFLTSSIGTPIDAGGWPTTSPTNTNTAATTADPPLNIIPH